MKKSHKGAYIAGGLAILAAGVGVWAYEHFYAGATTTLAAGAVGVPTPSNGQASLALPSGAKGWQSVTVGATAATAPTSATSHFTSAVGKGTVITAVWTDSTGATQTSVVTFT